MAGPRARKVRDWYIIALVSGEVLVGYLRREANGFTIHRVWGGRGGGGGEGGRPGAIACVSRGDRGEEQPSSRRAVADLQEESSCMRLVPQLPRRSRLRVLHLGRLVLCRLLGLRAEAGPDP